MKQNINSKIEIVFSVNDNYAKYLSACISSVVINSSNKFIYNLYVLYSYLNNENISKLKSLVRQKNNFIINFIDVKNLISSYNLNVKKSVSIETYFRLLIPYIFKEKSRVLYLDSDVVVNCNLVDLFFTDFKNNVFAAVKDVVGIGSSKTKYGNNRYIQFEKLNMKSYLNYFNAGVLLYNIKAINKIVTIKDMLDEAQQKKYYWQDQDVLNVIFEGKVLFLPFKYNMMVHNDYLKECKMCDENTFKSWLEDRNNPLICHYGGSGLFKPWNNKRFYCSYLFWKYLENSPYNNECLYEYKKHKIKFAFLKLFNKLFWKGSFQRKILKLIFKR